MHRHQQHVLLGGHPQQLCSKHRAAQIECPLHFLLDVLLDPSLPIRFRQSLRNALLSQLECSGWPDHLHPFSFRTRLDPRAQDLVPPNQLCEAAFQHLHAQLSLQSQRQCLVVRSAQLLQLLQEPQPLLPHGQHHRTFLRARCQRRQLQTLLLALRLIHVARQRRDSRCIE